MATTKELSVEDKLRALYDLQIIDTRIDEIRNVRGELPLEVEDLEDEVAGLSARLEKLQSEEGEFGRRKLLFYKKILTLVFAIGQSFLLLFYFYKFSKKYIYIYFYWWENLVGTTNY